MTTSFTKNQLSIQDLSNLCSIEKSTIRIWEKRYQLLSPKRTKTNIRYYELDDLKLLFNVKMLIDKGHKISKLAKKSSKELEALLTDNYENEFEVSVFTKKLLLAVLSYDKQAFENIYQELSQVLDFKDIYIEYIIPLLHYTGVLWQTNALDISHEHFLVEIIKQKMYSAIEKETITTSSNTTFVLFLPDNEIHDIGLIFLHYLLNKNNLKCIMLGATVPLEALEVFVQSDEKIVFATHVSSTFKKEELIAYLTDFSNQLKSTTHKKLWISGWVDEVLKQQLTGKHLLFIHSVDELEKAILQYN